MTTFNEETPTVVQTTDVRSSGPPFAPKRRKRFSSHSTRAITALALASLVGGGIDTALWPLRVLENGLIPFREGFRFFSPSFPLEIRVQGEMAQYYLIFTGLWILFYRKMPDPMQFFQGIRRIVLESALGAPHAVNSSPELSDEERAMANRSEAMSKIDERILHLRRRSSTMLISIGVLLVGAAFLIVFAGSLTNLDASAASNADRIQSEIQQAEARLGTLSTVLSLQQILQDPSQSEEKKKEARATLNFQYISSKTPGSVEATKAQIDVEYSYIRLLQPRLEKAWDKEISSERGYNDTRYLIATAITRVGVVLIIVFLVQILIGLYRYNTRLITFYASRMDVLQIWNLKEPSLERLQKVMAPDVDFGKEPKHPLEDIIRAAVSKLNIKGIHSDQEKETETETQKRKAPVRRKR